MVHLILVALDRVLATSLLLTAIHSSSKSDTKPLDPHVERVLIAQLQEMRSLGYDQAVLEPLHRAQAAKAEKDRIADIEAAKQAEIARQNHIKEVADRVVLPGTYTNGFAWGNCTYLVASMIPIPRDWHNANSWDDGARVDGWTISSEPVIGAIAQTDAGYWGHVALVVGIDGQNIRIIEENYQGLGIISYRTVNKNAFKYIY